MRLVLLVVWSLVSAMMIQSDVSAAQETPAAVKDWEALWTRVLQRSVNQAGQIDFAGLVQDRADLDHVVQFVATNDPDSTPSFFPTRAAKLAYYINAYNALAMHGVVDVGVPAQLGAIRKVTFFYFRRVSIGGKQISLYAFENDVIRPLGEERVHFALNCMVVGCPHLPRSAFTAAALEQQFDSAARLFVNEDRNVRVDTVKRTVELSSIFKFYTEDFLAKAPNLIAYVNRLRPAPIPEDFQVSFVDYDWTVNAQNGSTR